MMNIWEMSKIFQERILQHGLVGMTSDQELMILRLIYIAAQLKLLANSPQHALHAMLAVSNSQGQHCAKRRTLCENAFRKLKIQVLQLYVLGIFSQSF